MFPKMINLAAHLGFIISQNCLRQAGCQYERASTDFIQGVSVTGSPFRAEQLKKPPCICMHTVYVMYRKIKFLSMFFSLLNK